MNGATPLLVAVAAMAAIVMWTGPVASYPNPKLPEGNTTVFAVAQTTSFIHVFALGADGALYHKYQPQGQQPPANWTDWIMRSRAPGGIWDADPACGVDADGVTEVYIRYSTNLDLWQLYNTDVDDPNAWSTPRESACVSLPCNDTNPKDYWNTQPVFPTSDITLLNDPSDGHLDMFYRGFDGALYVCNQKPGTHQYTTPRRFDSIFE